MPRSFAEQKPELLGLEIRKGTICHLTVAVSWKKDKDLSFEVKGLMQRIMKIMSNLFFPFSTKLDEFQRLLVEHIALMKGFARLERLRGVGAAAKHKKRRDNRNRQPCARYSNHPFHSVQSNRAILGAPCLRWPANSVNQLAH